MLYHRQKEKLITEICEKTNQDSTQNSQTPNSIDKNRLTLRNKKKSLTALIARKTLNSQKSKQDFNQNSKDFPQQDVQSKNIKRHVLYKKNTDVKQQIEQRKTSIQSNTKSTQSSDAKKQIQNNLGQVSKKQFKLIYQLKKNKNQKKGGTSQKQSQIESRQTLSFVTNESNFKSSKTSKFSEYDNQSEKAMISSKRKINLEERIKKLKGEHQKKNNMENNVKQFKEDKLIKQDILLSIGSTNDLKSSVKLSSSRSNSRKKHHLKQTKQSTLNIKLDSLGKSKLTNQNSTKNIKISSQENISINKQNNQLKQQSFQIHIDSKILKKQSEPLPIVQSESFLPEQSFQKNNKLSSIKQQKNQDTIQKSIKASIRQRESIQTSNNKSSSGNSMNLSINSVVNRSNKRKHSFNLLQISENKQSKLRNSIESILSMSNNSKSKINLRFFVPQKNQKFNILDADQSDFQQNLTTMDRLNFHLDIIQTLSDFVYNSTQISTDAQEWEQLNFLVYKKFYIQRVKVLQFLKKYPMKNPFCIENASIQTKQILKLLKEPQIKEKKKMIEAQNEQIKKNLHCFYKQFDKQKYGQKINLFEQDNFSHWIYEELWEDFVLVEHNPDYSLEQIYQRMSRILQVGFLISEMNGNYVTPFKQAEEAIQKQNCRMFVQDNKQNYQKYILKR